jgi:DNA helicase IV
VLGWLRDPEMLSRVGEDVLSADELEVLRHGWTHDDFSVEDVPLVDELRYQVGDVPEDLSEVDDPLAHLVDENMPELTTITDREFSGPRTTVRTDDDTYAHVLVDEAQDLSPMQWRMVGRRGPAATWTVVGDPAQSSWPRPAEAQEARDLALYGDGDGAGAGRSAQWLQIHRPRHRFHLGTNYRNSAEIYRYAAQYADRVGLDADLPHAVRTTGIDPEERAVEDLAAAIRDAVGELLEAVAGTVGVVVPVARRAEVTALLADDPAYADALAGGDAARLVVLTGVDTKGLEFAGIVVADPEAIAAESPTGRATLYVVLTRATQRLVTIEPGAR